jgi:hypothetical protein
MDRTSDIRAGQLATALAARGGLVRRTLRRIRNVESSISYATKLLVGVCTVVLLTGLVITWVAHRGTRASTDAMTASLFRGVSGHAVAHTRQFLLDATPILESLRDVPHSDLAIDDPDRLARQLLVVLNAHPGFSWVSYGDEQGTYTGAFRTGDGAVRVTKRRIVEGRSPRTDYRVMPDGAWQVVRQEEDSGYDPRRRPFYTAAEAHDALVWIPPYVLFDSGLPGVACAAPVQDASGSLRGVLTIEFDLNALSDFVARQSISEHSRVFLFTADQVLLAHPDQPRITASGRRGAGRLLTLADVGDPLVDAFRAHLRPEHVAAPDANVPTFHLFDVHQGDTDYIASASGFRLGDEQTWLVGAVAPQSDFLTDVWRSQRVALAASMAAVLAALGLAAVLARRVSGPVKALIGFMGHVGRGDLEARADLGGSREFRQLAAALNGMIGDLRDRLRLRHSLAVAMEVQQRLLPHHPPAVRGLDIAGHSTYCDETGGDYYDFLVVEEASPHSVIVCLGDVTGHGVAAALVMAGARAVLRDRATAAGSLADVMDRLNPAPPTCQTGGL